MSRVPLHDLDAVPGKIRLNLAHAEATVEPQLRLGGAILGHQLLAHSLRELLILLAAKLEGGEYEWVQHVPIAKHVGVSDRQIDAINALDLLSPVFSDAERALLAFGQQVVETVRVDNAVFGRVSQHFSHREIVEAILTCGFYMTMARITEALQVPIDIGAGASVFANAQGGAEG